MAFANSAVTDLIATGIDTRSDEIADNVLSNNALLAALRAKGRVKIRGGGITIIEPISFAANGNGQWYSDFDLLAVQAQDVISGAQYQWKQYAIAVAVSGKEMRQNSGREQLLDLVEGRIENAESTMSNDINVGAYSDGTGSGGKQLGGLDAAIPTTAKASQTDTYGGIDRTVNAFWRTSTTTAQDISSTTKVQTVMNTQWATQVRGADRPDLILMDQLYWADFMASVQNIQRITDPASAHLGFPSLKYITADAVLDPTTGVGTGGGAVTKTAYFLNTKYLRLNVHKDANFAPLDPERRYSVNQDAMIKLLGFMGQITVSNAALQGRSIATTT